jgi:DNA-binding winged helix-turn-helix (wHTH) protein/TolB-like protein
VAAPADNRIRFGTFDFDPVTRELRREGAPVRLQPQPAQVLACLLAKPGEIVTREEIRQAVWGNETTVDFDRNVNFCIAQIRSALGDSPESPTFVKTLPKRGYQFIAPVSVPRDRPTHEPQYGKRKTPMLLAIAAAVLVAGFLLVRTPKVQTDPPVVAVARFDNLSGDASLDGFTDGLTGAVIGELTAVSDNKFAVVGNAAILRKPRAERDLVAIQQAVKATTIVLGEIQRDTSGIELFAQLISLPDQRHLKAIRVRTPGTNALQDQSELARRVRESFLPRLTFPAKQ